MRRLVATNGRHLYSSNSFSQEFSHDGEWKPKTGKDHPEDETHQIQLSTRRWRFITREIEGNYPNWWQVIPSAKDAKTQIDFDPATVEQVIQTIQRMPCHDSTNFVIGIEVANGKLQLLGRSQGAEHWTKVEVPTVNLSGRQIMVFLNREFFSKALTFGLTRVDLIDAMSPLRFNNGGRQMIIMPVKSEVTLAIPVSPPVSEPNGEGAAGPVASGTDQPATAETQAAIQSTERTQMVNQT